MREREGERNRQKVEKRRVGNDRDLRERKERWNREGGRKKLKERASAKYFIIMQL